MKFDPGFRSAGDAASFMLRLSLPQISKYVTAHKNHSKYDKARTPLERYKMVLEFYFSRHPVTKKIADQSILGKNGDYTALAARLIQHGA